ncbi:MAG: hypothetical protein ACPIOQ_32265, partial [Promethearchaeia archaeon]
MAAASDPSPRPLAARQVTPANVPSRTGTNSRSAKSATGSLWDACSGESAAPASNAHQCHAVDPQRSRAGAKTYLTEHKAPPVRPASHREPPPAVVLLQSGFAPQA